MPRFPGSADSLPRAIAVGDLNHDGFHDMVVPNSGMHYIGVFLRRTNGTFADQATYSTDFGSTSYALVTADFNSDDHLDIAVANFGGHSIGLVLCAGNGSGTFTSQMIHFTGLRSQPYSVALVDLDSDGRLDIAVTNYAASATWVFFFRHGNGSFANQRAFDTGFGSHPVALAIVAANNGYGNIDILMRTC